MISEFGKRGPGLVEWPTLGFKSPRCAYAYDELVCIFGVLYLASLGVSV